MDAWRDEAKKKYDHPFGVAVGISISQERTQSAQMFQNSQKKLGQKGLQTAIRREIGLKNEGIMRVEAFTPYQRRAALLDVVCGSEEPAAREALNTQAPPED